ncbi:MAG: hypothetical protein CSYNP_01163 [Syntrophus sp. SKADARSKE-3]|nr:hypothetical protein [Syntrophus sp. SKADARSKE-3]
MKMQDIRMIAKEKGVNAKVGRSKQDVIREIQVKEGNSPCFRTEIKDKCNEWDCLWRSDCST